MRNVLGFHPKTRRCQQHKQTKCCKGGSHLEEYNLYNLQCLHKDDVRGAMLEVKPPCTSSSGNLEHWKRASIQLSQNELSALGNGSTLQVSCTSIIVKSGHYYYKRPLLASEELTPRNRNCISIIFRLKQYSSMVSCTFIVPHSPLTHSAVKECLFDLVQKIHTALQEFRGLGFAHYDVRYVLMTTIMLF